MRERAQHHVALAVQHLVHREIDVVVVGPRRPFARVAQCPAKLDILAPEGLGWRGQIRDDQVGPRRGVAAGPGPRRERRGVRCAPIVGVGEFGDPPRDVREHLERILARSEVARQGEGADTLIGIAGLHRVDVAHLPNLDPRADGIARAGEQDAIHPFIRIGDRVAQICHGPAQGHSLATGSRGGGVNGRNLEVRLDARNANRAAGGSVVRFIRLEDL